MFLMYVDESGTATISNKNDTKFLVLTGWIVEESDKKEAEDGLRAIKEKFYGNLDIEFKSSYLRYANPKLRNASPLKLNDEAKYDALEKEVADLLKSLKGAVICIVIEKAAYLSKYPGQNPYDAAYIFLMERFQTFLEFHEANGICVVDPREGTVGKRFTDKDLGETHDLVRWHRGFWKKCPRIIERALFASSDLICGLQIADLYSYPTFHVFEYNKKREEYWRFADITYPKLYYHTKIVSSTTSPIGPVIDGTGLKVFPRNIKAACKYYQH